MDGALGFSIAVLTIFFLISGIYGLEYPVSKKFKRAKISGGSATILTDPIFEIFQNLADVIHGDYLIVKAEYDHLNEELEFYISQANENKDASDRGFTVREYSAKMVENLRELKNEVIGKHLSYIEKMGHNFRSLLMMFTPVGKFEQSYKVYRKILSFWITKLWTFLAGLVGHKLFSRINRLTALGCSNEAPFVSNGPWEVQASVIVVMLPKLIVGAFILPFIWFQLCITADNAYNRTPIYSYFSPIADIAKHEHLSCIRIWARNWYSCGFMPILLRQEDAAAHPMYDEFVSKVSLFPSVNPANYDLACYLRWLAFAKLGGGVMTDYDLVYYGSTESASLNELHQKVAAVLKERGALGPRDHQFPMVAYSGKASLEEILLPHLMNYRINRREDVILVSVGANRKRKVQHLSDMTILRKADFASMLPPEVEKPFKDVIHFSSHLVDLFIGNSTPKSTYINLFLQARFLNDRRVVFLDTFDHLSQAFLQANGCLHDVDILLGNLTGLTTPISRLRNAKERGESLILTSDIVRQISSYKNQTSYYDVIEVADRQLHLDADIAADFPGHLVISSSLSPLSFFPKDLPIQLSRNFYVLFLEHPRILIYEQWQRYQAQSTLPHSWSHFMTSSYYKPNMMCTMLEIKDRQGIENFLARQDSFVGFLTQMTKSVKLLEYQVGLDLSGHSIHHNSFSRGMGMNNGLRQEATRYFETEFADNQDIYSQLQADNLLDLLLYDIAARQFDQNYETILQIESQIEPLSY